MSTIKAKDLTVEQIQSDDEVIIYDPDSTQKNGESAQVNIPSVSGSYIYTGEGGLI